MSKAAFAGLKAVQEIRFHLCQTSKGSEGVRNFLLKSYKNMKAASPATPILIREASGVEGGLVARYGSCLRPLHYDYAMRAIPSFLSTLQSG
jgi:NADH dehydrogenase (ubiquinone) 1 alpha subcomplex subunit 2